jgi:hypothetical protein
LSSPLKANKVESGGGFQSLVYRCINQERLSNIGSPQLIGPPGVGKTAILEGLASRIVSKEVPEVPQLYLVAIKPLTSGVIANLQSLQHKRVLSIDLAAIMAGSGIRGQFEEKFKALLRDIEEEVRGPLEFLYRPPLRFRSIASLNSH